MPNIITHKIFAETVASQCANKDIKELLEKHEQLFGIGANGPDFLFFYHMRPWEMMKEHSLNHIGSALHSTHINDFYESAMTVIQKEEDKQIKERELVYVMGHLCHWALDMTSHPYIFYRTGNGRGISAGKHHRFESVLDAVMLNLYRRQDIREYRAYEICEFDRDMLQAIARVYVPAVQTALGETLRVYQVRQSLEAWKDVQKMLYDPHHRKVKILQRMERMIHQPLLISGNIIPCAIEDDEDVLNLSGRPWLHPCDAAECHHNSFLDLFEQAQVLALQTIECLYHCIVHESDPQLLLNLLQDRAYDSGRKEGIEMKYFEVMNDETI